MQVETRPVAISRQEATAVVECAKTDMEKYNADVCSLPKKQ
jgi:hypothetical protein